MPIVPLPLISTPSGAYDVAAHLEQRSASDDHAFWGSPSDLVGLAVSSVAHLVITEIDGVCLPIEFPVPTVETAWQVCAPAPKPAGNFAAVRQLLPSLAIDTPKPVLRKLDIAHGTRELMWTPTSRGAKGRRRRHRQKTSCGKTKIFKCLPACIATTYAPHQPPTESQSVDLAGAPDCDFACPQLRRRRIIPLPDLEDGDASDEYNDDGSDLEGSISVSLSDDDLYDLDADLDIDDLECTPRSPDFGDSPISPSQSSPTGLQLNHHPAPARPSRDMESSSLARLPIADVRVPFDIEAELLPAGKGKSPPWVSRRVTFREGGPSWRVAS